ncbi:MAG: tRNA (guanosine(37)-N1)-methyltransferase TrmD [Syntrophobacterales bacterium]|nr:tRNA (guanosine(37)-N1)-methyltransferase TrmD [Syntrophobacterales bacterium]
MRFDILSIFPEMFESFFGCSLLKKARDKGLIRIETHDIRDGASDRHRMTDDYPYGGGAGMVMKVEPIARVLEAIGAVPGECLRVLLTPQGETFNQAMAAELARSGRIALICGHYEGVDERVRQHLVDREISIGDYILTGGEAAAMVIVDAVARLIPGVLGNDESVRHESFAMGILESPQYTRPEDFRGWKVPEVLLSGHHRQIEEWRRREALKRTLRRRPDLLAGAALTAMDRKILEELKKES